MSTEHEVLADASAFADVLGPSLTAVRSGKPVRFDVVRLSPLRIGSGRITACDGLIMKGEPFAQPVPNGSHDLTLGIGVIGRDERVAFARVCFAAAPVVRWDAAAAVGRPTGDRPGYGVDYAKGCLADAAALAVIDGADLVGEMDDAASEVYAPDREWVVVTAKQGSAAVFSSGFGDGFYTSYLGFDAGGRLAALLTDFDVVEWPGRPKPV